MILFRKSSGSCSRARPLPTWSVARAAGRCAIPGTDGPASASCSKGAPCWRSTGTNPLPSAQAISSCCPPPRASRYPVSRRPSLFASIRMRSLKVLANCVMANRKAPRICDHWAARSCSTGLITGCWFPCCRNWCMSVARRDCRNWCTWLGKNLLPRNRVVSSCCRGLRNCCWSRPCARQRQAAHPRACSVAWATSDWPLP
ncbi:hypothetical protein D9M71_649540 [compost metagenome]